MVYGTLRTHALHVFKPTWPRRLLRVRPFCSEISSIFTPAIHKRIFSILRQEDFPHTSASHFSLYIFPQWGQDRPIHLLLPMPFIFLPNHVIQSANGRRLSSMTFDVQCNNRLVRQAGYMSGCGVHPPSVSDCILASSRMAFALRLQRHQEAIRCDEATSERRKCKTDLHRVQCGTQYSSARSVTWFENYVLFRTRFERGRSRSSYDGGILQ